ncbi:MAG: hypothetical protein LBI19_02975, partial [Oscillospiraceae bacterium]|nr:hypothetical protein [Oscillospiraceae bacterium]
MKRNIIIAIVGVALLGGMAVFALNGTNIKRNVITIDRREIDAMVQKASLFMSDYSERDAENFIIRRETLYAVA